jgi:hypothetical protein
MIQRRSRMQRARTGKRIALSPRDFAIFRRLREYRYLPSTYIHAFVGGASQTRFKERLGDLFHEGFIDRPDQQWCLSDARCAPVTHEMGEGARRALLARPDSDADARTFLASTAHRQYAHSLLICEVLASIELGARAAGVRFISWAEILARAPEATQRLAKPFALPQGSGDIVPDALFGLEYANDGPKSYRFFALEIDRGTMPVVRANGSASSYLAKLEAYQRVIEGRTFKAHLGISSFLVLTVTTNEARVNTMMRSCCGRARENSAFLFKTIPARALSHGLPTPDTNLFCAPWLRPGHQPLEINAP